LDLNLIQSFLDDKKIDQIERGWITLKKRICCIERRLVAWRQDWLHWMKIDCVKRRLIAWRQFDCIERKMIDSKEDW